MKKVMTLLCMAILISSALGYTVTGEMNVDKEKYFTDEKIILEVIINNHGFTDAKNVELNIDVPSEIGEDRAEVFSVQDREQEEITFDIPVPEGIFEKDYLFRGTVEFEGETYQMKEKSIEINENPLVIETDTENGEFSFSVKNTARDTIKNAFVEFDFSDTLKTDSNLNYNIGELTEGESWSKTISFHSEKRGIINTILEYQDSDGYDHSYTSYLSTEPVSNEFTGLAGIEWLLLIVIAIVVLKLFVFK